MSFTTITFIVFIIFSFSVYYLLPLSFRWIWLLACSYIFYGWSDPTFLLFLLFSTLTTWLFPIIIGRVNSQQASVLSSEKGKAITKAQKKEIKIGFQRQKKLLLFLCLLCNIGLLSFLKYSNFFIGIFNTFGFSIKPLDWLVLPLGISFYIFQSLGYCIDVYRGVTEPQANFFKYALYTSFFPQICQGPIGRYNDLAPQLFKGHCFEYDSFVAGLERMLLGFFKKLVVANRIGLFVDAVFAAPWNYSGFIIVLSSIMYAFQLYADFSGYMDIAIGIGKCFGIRLEENFDTPYFSKSITEFWRRWHITLGSWFRDYLYYPILRSKWSANISKYCSKKNRKKIAAPLTTAIGLALTWLLIGLWHGPAWKYVLYGVYHGTFIVFAVLLGGTYSKLKNKLHIRESSRIWNLFQIIRTFSIVSLGYVLFRSESLKYALIAYKQIVFHFISTSTAQDTLFNNIAFGKFYWILVFFLLLVCFTIELISVKQNIIQWLNSKKAAVKWPILYAFSLAIWLLTDWGITNAGNFLYFKF